MARGRGVRPGTKLGRVSNLSVAPTVLGLLGLPVPASMEARPRRPGPTSFQEAPAIEALWVGLDSATGHRKESGVEGTESAAGS